MIRFLTACLAVLMLAGGAASGEVIADGGGGRLFHEIRMTAAGTRSQGWRGMLFDRQGHVVTLQPGQRLETGLGTFEGVACTHPWRPCGAIHVDMLAWMKTHQANAIMGPDNWVWQVRVLAEGTRSQGFEGELSRGGTRLQGCSSPIDTPFGPFMCRVRKHAWDRAGWFHESWLLQALR